MSEYEKLVALVGAHQGEPENPRNIREVFDGLLLAEELLPLRPLAQMGNQEQRLLFLRRCGVNGADTQCNRAYAAEAWALQLEA